MRDFSKLFFQKGSTDFAWRKKGDTGIISLACLSASRTEFVSVERVTKMMAFRCPGFVFIALVSRHIEHAIKEVKPDYIQA